VRFVTSSPSRPNVPRFSLGTQPLFLLFPDSGISITMSPIRIHFPSSLISLNFQEVLGNRLPFQFNSSLRPFGLPPFLCARSFYGVFRLGFSLLPGKSTLFLLISCFSFSFYYFTIFRFLGTLLLDTSPYATLFPADYEDEWASFPLVPGF